MMRPHDRYEHQVVADRVRQAERDRRARNVRHEATHTNRAVVGLMITWSLAMVAIVVVLMMAI